MKPIIFVKQSTISAESKSILEADGYHVIEVDGMNDYAPFVIFPPSDVSKYESN